jgi:FdrA protein
VFAPICQRIMEAGGPQIVVYVLGTDADPQHYTSQVAALSKAGCLVPATNARAAILAAHLADRDTSHETLAE